MINWYVDYLYDASRKNNFCFLRTGISEQLISTYCEHADKANSSDVPWAKKFRNRLQHRDFFRVVIPCYFEKHFTVVVLDIPQGVAKRSARAVFVDPLQEYRNEVTNTFLSWFKFTVSDNLSSILVHGGDQGYNTSECGIFAMLNLQILLTTKTFFPLEDWQKESLKRTCKTCIEARVEYAAVLRQHIIEYICAGSPFLLPQLQQGQPQAVNAASAPAPAIAPASASAPALASASALALAPAPAYAPAPAPAPAAIFDDVPGKVDNGPPAMYPLEHHQQLLLPQPRVQLLTDTERQRMRELLILKRGETLRHLTKMQSGSNRIAEREAPVAPAAPARADDKHGKRKAVVVGVGAAAAAADSSVVFRSSCSA